MLLRQCLHPLHTNSWISNWLLSDLNTTPFHTDHLLPISRFHHANLFENDTRFYNSDHVDTTINIQYQAHLAYIPVTTFDNFILGYVICLRPQSPHHISIDRAPFSSPFVARFLFNVTNNDLTVFIPSPSHQLLSIIKLDTSNQVQYTFFVPANDYIWPHLPTNPSGCMKGSAFSSDAILRPINHYRPSSMSISDSKSTSVHGLLAKLSVTSVSASPSHPTPIYKLLSYKHNITFQSHLAKIFRCLHISFGHRVNDNDLRLPGYDHFLGLRNPHHGVYQASRSDTKLILPICAYIYYSTVLSVNPDAPLLTTIVPTQRVEQAEPPPAPPPKNEKIRKKNLLTMGRKNAQKYKEIEDLKMDLENSNRLVKQLEAMQKKIAMKNKELKKFIIALKNH